MEKKWEIDTCFQFIPFCAICINDNPENDIFHEAKREQRIPFLVGVNVKDK